MNISIRSDEDISILDLDGRLVAGTGDTVLRDAVDRELSSGASGILLNLSNVSAIDSSGVAELVAGMRSAKTLGAGFCTTRLSERVERVLTLSRILPLLDVHPTEEDALASLRA